MLNWFTPGNRNTNYRIPETDSRGPETEPGALEIELKVHRLFDALEHRITKKMMSNNQDEWFRRAGAGIYAWDHEMNLSMVVPRLVQTNQRVELLAVVVACLLDPRP